MLAKLMQSRSGCHGSTITRADGLKGAGVVLGGTALSVFVATWMQRRSVDPFYTQTLMLHGWLFAFVLSMPYTTLKGWPRRLQAIFIGVLLTVLASIAFGAAWINN